MNAQLSTIETVSTPKFRVFGSYLMTEAELTEYLDASTRKRDALKVEFANGGVMTDVIADRIAGYMGNWRKRYLARFQFNCSEHGVPDFCEAR